MKALILGAALLAAPAFGQSQQVMPEVRKGRNQPIPMICAPDARTLYNALYDTHSENPVVFGFSNQGHVAVVWFTDPDRTTLSIVIDTPTESCMIFSTRCLPGDCYVTGPKLHEEEVEKQLESPKVQM